LDPRLYRSNGSETAAFAFKVKQLDPRSRASEIPAVKLIAPEFFTDDEKERGA
jgi:hypothetical protein